MYIYNTTKKEPRKIFIDTNSINLTLENQNYINELKLLLKTKTGSGLLNSMLKKLPLPEMHLNLLKTFCLKILKTDRLMILESIHIAVQEQKCKGD